MERFRDDLLARAGAVDVGGVDERHSELDRTTQDADAFVTIVDDAHRAEAEAAHLELATEHERRIHARDSSG